MQKKTFSLSTIAIILGLVFITLITIRTISTPEIWTHLAQGKNNVPLSYLDTQESTALFADGSAIYDTAINPSYLYDKITYTLWKMGGATALILVNSLLLLVTFLLLIRISMKWGGGLSQGFALLLCGHILFQNMDVGPQTVAMLFIALFIYLLSTIKKPLYLFATILPLQILWANLHSSFLFGVIITICIAIDTWKAAKIKTRNHLPKTSSSTLWILAGLLLIVPIANPHFHNLYKQVFADLIHQAPLYNATIIRSFYPLQSIKPLIFFTLVLGAAGLVSYKKTLPFFTTALAILGGIIAWGMPHLAHIFVALSFPFIVLSFSATGTSLARSIRSFIKNRDQIFLPTSLTLFFILFIFSVLPVFTGSAYTHMMSSSSFGFGFEESLYPNDLDDLFSDPSFPDKYINLPADGGYIALNYDKKIFLDYRSGRYPRKLLIATEEMFNGDLKSYNKMIDTYRPEALIISTIASDTSIGVARLLNTKIWRLVYFDGTTVVLLQNNKKFASIINNKKLQKDGVAKIDRDLKLLIQQLETTKHPRISPRLIGAANIYLAFNRPKQSEEIFKPLLQAKSSLTIARIGLGKSQYFLKNFEDANKNLEIAAKEQPDNLIVWSFYADTCAKLNLPEKQKLAAEQIKQIIERRKEEEKKKEEEKESTISTNTPPVTL